VEQARQQVNKENALIKTKKTGRAAEKEQRGAGAAESPHTKIF
jgi:hypothetical protein